MTVAELFVNLGIKGATKVSESLSSVQQGLAKTADMSLAAKAGILGLIIGLEQMTKLSTQAAMDLTSFAGATGLSSIELQKWQYAAQLGNVSAEEMTSTLKNLQSLTSRMKLGEGIPGGALLLGIDLSKGPTEILKKLHENIVKIKDPGIARELANKLGLSDNFVAFAKSDKFGLQGLRQELILTEQDQARLSRLGKAWIDFWLTFRGGFAKRAADIEGPLTATVSTISNALFELIDLSAKFTKAIKSISGPNTEAGFKTLALAIAAALAPIAPLLAGLTAVVAILDDIYKYTHGKDSLLGSLVKNKDSVGEIFGIGQKHESDYLSGPLKEKKEREEYNQALLNFLTFGLAGKFQNQGGAQQGDTNVNATIHVDGSQDPHATAKAVHREISDAVFQNPALSHK